MLALESKTREAEYKLSAALGFGIHVPHFLRMEGSRMCEPDAKRAESRSLVTGPKRMLSPEAKDGLSRQPPDSNAAAVRHTSADCVCSGLSI